MEEGEARSARSGEEAVGATYELAEGGLDLVRDASSANEDGRLCDLLDEDGRALLLCALRASVLGLCRGDERGGHSWVRSDVED